MRCLEQSVPTHQAQEKGGADKMRSKKFFKVTSAPPSTPDMSDVEENGMPTNSQRDENSFQESEDNFSSPDIWDNNVNILETSQGILSTSDIFEGSDSGEDELIPNTSTPEAFVSGDSLDGNSVKSVKLDQHSFETNSTKDMSLSSQDSISPKESSAEMSTPVGLLKVNSSSPEYLDLYSQDIFDVNSITVDKFYATKSPQDTENSFLQDLTMRPKTSYKVQDISVFNISQEVNQILVPATETQTYKFGKSNKDDLKKIDQSFQENTSVFQNIENIFYMDGEGKYELKTWGSLGP